MTDKSDLSSLIQAKLLDFAWLSLHEYSVRYKTYNYFISYSKYSRYYTKSGILKGIKKAE